MDNTTRGVRLRILLVDDEPEILRVLQRGLCQHETVAVETGEAAIRLLDQRRFDVVVSDNDMGAISGLVLLSHVQWAHPEVHRVLFSGTTRLGPDDLAALLRAGIVHRVVSKPGFAELLRLCNQLAAGERAA